MKIAKPWRGGFIAALACLLLSNSIALAQSPSSSVRSQGGSFLGELKDMLHSPALSSFVQSKVVPGLRDSQWRDLPLNLQPQQGPVPDNYYRPRQTKPYYSDRNPYHGENSYNDNASGDTPSGNAPAAFRTLLPREVRALGRYDISVLIDRSGSMSTQDCPSPYSPDMAISRWDWCREQTAYLARETSSLSRTITVVPFANKAQRFEHATAADIHGIFSMTSPRGSTNLAGALKIELETYIQAKEAGIRMRPLMIAVISDGVPSSKAAVKRVIADATRRLSNPDEIRITFLQVGTDDSGTRFLQELDRDLLDEGAVADIVKTRDFNQLLYTGLPAALASSLSDRAF